VIGRLCEEARELLEGSPLLKRSSRTGCKEVLRGGDETGEAPKERDPCPTSEMRKIASSPTRASPKQRTEISFEKDAKEPQQAGRQTFIINGSDKGSYFTFTIKPR